LQKKRQLEGADPNELTMNGAPAWVISFELADVWRRGEVPPPEVQLSKAAVAQVKRLKEWAVRRRTEAIERDARARAVAAYIDQECENLGIDNLPPPQPQPRPEPQPAAPTQFDPAVLARAAQLANGPRVV